MRINQSLASTSVHQFKQYMLAFYITIQPQPRRPQPHFLAVIDAGRPQP
jgi:hypothetical protein